MQKREALKQPAGLTVCFLTEMWERYGFYIIQSLLILYMTHQFGFSDVHGYTVLGTYGAFAYIAPVVGGYIADRMIGYAHAVILGGVLFCVGYAMLALPSSQFFYMGLAIAAMGNGFFKPNISTFLGTMYRTRDPRRERGFTIFYVGINLGGFLATVSSGYVVRYFGWNASFILAAIGLGLGICVFVFGCHYLHRRNKLTLHKQPDLVLWGKRNIALLYIGVIASIFIISECLTIAVLGNFVLLVSGVGVLVVLFMAAWRCEKQERNNMIICIVLILMSIFFWSTFFQAFYSLNLYVDRVVDRNFMGHVLPTPLFIGLEQIFIFVLGPLLGWWWLQLENQKRNPTIAVKFAIAFLFMTIGFFALWLGNSWVGSDELVKKGWIVALYFFFTVGELLLSPTAMAAITELAPARYVGMMIGIWFVSLGFGVKGAGLLANFAAVPGGVTQKAQIISIYGGAFEIYTGITLVVFLIMLSLVPYVNRLISLHNRQH